MVTNDDVGDLTAAFLDLCPTPASLHVPNGYRDAGLALVDAVFSMQARYESVQAVVRRYADAVGVEPAGLTPGAGPDMHGVAALNARLAGVSEDDLVEIFGNRSKHAATNRTKSSLVQEVAASLAAAPASVDGRDTVAEGPASPGYLEQKRAWTAVRGLGPVTFEYFRMNCGRESVKPDIMIQRFVERAIGRTPPWRETIALMTDVTAEISHRWATGVSVRAVDHTIWLHESGRQ